MPALPRRSARDCTRCKLGVRMAGPRGDESSVDIRRADAPPIDEWQRELTQAVFKLSKDGYFKRGRTNCLYWIIAVGLWWFTNREWTAVTYIMVGLSYFVWQIVVSLIRHRTQVTLARSSLVEKLAAGRLDLSAIQRHIPPQFSKAVRPKPAEGLAGQLKILAENLDWFLRPTPKLFRMSWIWVWLYLAWFLVAMYLVWLDLRGPSAIPEGTFYYIAQGGIAVLMLGVWILPLIRREVWPEELFRDLGELLGQDFFTTYDERKGGAEAFLKELALAVSRTAQHVGMGYMLVAAAPLLVMAMPVASGALDIYTTSFAVICLLVAGWAGWMELRLHRQETSTALDESSMAVKLLADEIDPDGFSLWAKWTAVLFGAPLRRGSIIRTATLAALEPWQLLRLPRPRPVWHWLGPIHLGTLAVCATAFIGLAESRYQSIGITITVALVILLLSWGWHAALIGFGCRGVRTSEFLKHLQARLSE